MSPCGLSEALRPYLPANRAPLLEESLREVEDLPGVGKWIPPGPFIQRMIPREVLWGFPFTFLKDIPSLDPLRKKIGTCIGDGKRPDPTNCAEVSAAALAKALGACQLERIKETNKLTPDFRVWWEKHLVEMEVTRADRKRSEVERTVAADRLRDQVRCFGRSCDIVIHVADIPSEEDRQQILQAARELEAGRQVENPGKWRVRAETPRRDGNYHVAGGQSDAAPAWWPEEEVAAFSHLNSSSEDQTTTRSIPRCGSRLGRP